jgi:hypothetical protein
MSEVVPSKTPGEVHGGRAARPLGRPALIVLIPTLVILGASFFGLTQAESHGAKEFLDNLHWSIAYTAAAALGWVGWRQARADDRAARFWFATGLSTYALGQWIWDVQVWVDWRVFPGPSDLLYLTLGPLLVGALSDFCAISLGLGKGEGVRWALLISASLGVIACAAFWTARKVIKQDMED